MNKETKSIHIKVDIFDIIVQVNNQTYKFEPNYDYSWLRVFSKSYPDIYLSDELNNQFLDLLNEQLNDVSNISLMIIEFNEHNVYYVDLRIIEHIMKINNNYDILIKINYGYERYPISLPYEYDNKKEKSWNPDWNFDIDKHEYKYIEYFTGLKYLFDKYNNFSQLDIHIYILFDHIAFEESNNKIIGEASNVLNAIDINIKKIYNYFDCKNYQKYLNYVKLTNNFGIIDYEYLDLWSQIN